MDELFNLQKLNNDLYVLDYPVAYGLPDFLQHGARGTYGLSRFVQKYNRLPKKPGLDKGGFACSTFHAKTPNGHELLGRNFDYKDAPCLIVRCRPADGYRSIGITDFNVMLYGRRRHNPDVSDRKRLYMAPYCCMDGINEKGLAVAVLEIKAKATRQKTGKLPITTTSVIRAVLDCCACVEEAVRLFRQYDMRAALFCDYHYHLVDRTGKSVLIEYVSNRMHVLSDHPYATNFYFLPGGDNRKEMGRDRAEKIRKALTEHNGILGTGEAMQLLSDCRLSYRHKLGYPVTSLWSAVYDCSSNAVTVCAGMHYEESFEFSVVL